MNQQVTILDSRWKWILLLLGVFTLLWFLIEPAFERVRSRPLPEHVRKLRRIDLALATYHHRYGSLPYDPRGPDHALYRLHGLIDASQFDLTEEDAAVPACWDHQHQRLQGGDVEYPNRPGMEPHWK